MDKETLTEINGILKTGGEQALSLDELDSIVGGVQGYYQYPDGQVQSKQHLMDIWLSVAMVTGYDTAAKLFCDYYGINKNEISECRIPGNEPESMELLLNKFFAMHETEDGR